MAKHSTITIDPEVFAELDEFVREHGFMKSKLISKLVRDFLKKQKETGFN